jgi:hemoglobin
MSDKSLYERLGGYDVVVVAVDEILPRLMKDSQLERFWQNRGADGVARERQLLIDYLSSASGGPMYYTGRNMKLSHEGMGISESDWSIFISHVADALDHLSVSDPERGDVLGFIESLKGNIVEVPERKPLQSAKRALFVMMSAYRGQSGSQSRGVTSSDSDPCCVKTQSMI